ncbi:hypothetical protein QYE76_050770 [Lolium multiflorum]|uniref:RNase H type-1 domain-containing protein n=1 Tax=Lolium multiflorum TaxID=4521 RepID=A0AAD8SQN7_LOLMU|nr:hypothetical protein QYE76_050770 [Lolium multiflorum]
MGSSAPGQAQETLPAHQPRSTPAVIFYCRRAPGLVRRQCFLGLARSRYSRMGYILPAHPGPGKLQGHLLTNGFMHGHTQWMSDDGAEVNGATAAGGNGRQEGGHHDIDDDEEFVAQDDADQYHDEQNVEDADNNLDDDEELAPTVGLREALAGVHIRAGLLDVDGERTVSALVQNIYAMDFINDNAGCFANGGKFPKNGRIIEFGSHRIYFGTVPVRQRLSPVLVAPDPPRWLCAGRAAGSVEVMMAGVAGAGKDTVEQGAGRAASTRPAKPPLERDAGAAGASSAPPETPLQAAMNVLATPIAQNIDPATAQAQLEETRKTLLSGGANILQAQRELNLTLREYNAAHGFASVSAHAARMPENRLKARNLDQDLRSWLSTLNVRKDAKPVRQPLRRFAEDRRKIIGDEVTKLLVAGFIVEVTHIEWLANPVMVEKKKDENLEAKAPKVWRMCIDYTNLNKACPRDPFPLPRIDQVIDSTAGSTNRVVSVVVVVEREEEEKIVQRPVYYLSEVLSLSKQNYPHFQKMTYGVYMAATKLKHYFEEHPMKVVSEAPISDIMGNKDASGRIAKWAIQLSPYVPVYERRDAIKSHALADFLVDWAEMQYKPPEHKIKYWKMHFDGSKLKEGLGAGVVLTSPKGDHLRYVLQVHFRASNNVAEYEALIHGLKVAKEIGAHRIICYGDSDLVVQQCSGDWDAKDANMASYRFHVQKIAGFFEGCEFHHVPRAENDAADALSKLGSSRQEIPPGIALAHLRVPSIKPSPESESIFVPESHVVPMDIDEGNPGAVPAHSGTAPADPGTAPVSSGTATPIPEEALLVDSMDIDVPVFVVREAPSWVKPIKEFLINGNLPVDETESRRIQRRAKAYTFINGEVYKRSVTGVLQRCVEPEEGKEMLKEIHQGECGHHASSRALVAKVFRHGFYWPTALENAEDLVRKCNGCQRYAKQNHTPASKNYTVNMAICCLVP